MAARITVTPRTLPNLKHSPPKDHHVGSPPTFFKNPWPSAGISHGLRDILSTRFGSERNLIPVPQGPNGTRSKELVRIVKPDFGASQRDCLRATWIGHASVFVEFPAAEGAPRGVRVLFDPVFSERTSPSSFFGPKRYSPTPCTLEELPEPDIVCISHNHYDHLDHATVSQLHRRRLGQIHFFAALGNKDWFQQNVPCQGDEVTELDWWDSRTVEVEGIGSINLTCTPTQHISRRSLRDGNRALWCSFALEGAGKKLYFSGDTAYQAADTPSPCSAFEEIGKVLGPFDLSYLPIGLYSPPHLMGNVHATPEQSIRIHQDVNSKLSIGMHYGTFRGGISAHYEDVREPPQRWRDAALKEDIWCGGGIAGDGSEVDRTKEGVGLCHLGETITV